MTHPTHRLGRLVAAGVLAVAAVVPQATNAAAAPADFPIKGLDVSAFQGSIDWAAVAGSGVRFAYIRASEQAGIADTTFAANYAGAKANGLYAGAYHRARPDVSGGKAQADYLVDHASFTADGRTLPLMLDIEWPRSNWTGLNACYNMTPTQLVAWIREFVNEIAVRTGRLALVYTNTNWWNPCTASNNTFGANPLTIANYSAVATPPLPAGWSRFTFWQHTSTGRVPGIAGDVDLDVFNGDRADLAWLGGGVPDPPMTGLLARVNHRYVTAESAGTKPLVANRTQVRLWEEFSVVDAGGGFIALRARVNNRYVTAESAGTKPLIANRTAIGPWEKFRFVANADGSVSLLANVNNKYVSTDSSAGTNPLIANRAAIGPLEKFDRVVPPRTASLRATANARYVTADRSGAAPLIANRGSVGAWEQFAVVDAGSGTVALLALVNGMYVTAETAGAKPLIANRTAVGPWERFRLVNNSDGTVSLLATINNKYVTADAGTQPLIAGATTIGAAEKFALVTY